MTEVPPDHILYDEALKIATETSQSQGRETQRQGGESASGGNNENGMSHRRHPAEFYAGRTDQDGGGRGNQHTVGNGNNGNGSNGGGGGGGGGNGNETGDGGNVTAVKVEQEVDVVMKTEPEDNATGVVVVGKDANAGRRVEGAVNKVEEVKSEPVKVETVAETGAETVGPSMVASEEIETTTEDVVMTDVKQEEDAGVQVVRNDVEAPAEQATTVPPMSEDR